ncbi:hydrogenase maturation protease [Halorhabdus salina]|uniref:hydrogenase maturation protease n=1 Tax=Halorhabdus salina TaxID=2750670 RepID=UPI0015EFB693|nr:hydrogenase maturation protease [Halorhabdus salina]
MAEPPSIDSSERVAVLGIGSALRGDDAVGLELLRRLESRAAPSEDDRLLFVEGGVAPENHTGVIRRFDPDWIVLIDAVAFDADPGSGKWVDPDDLGGESFSSHKSTPAMLRTFLARETGAQVVLFGVQPAAIESESELSSALTECLGELVERLAQAIETG